MDVNDCNCYNPQPVYTVRYPDVYYMVQPVVHRTCMEMDDLNRPFPTQAEVDTMTDRVYNELIRDYPEMWDEGDQVTGEQYWDDDRFRRDRRFPIRRRGIFRDLVAILLLQELFRRRRVF